MAGVGGSGRTDGPVRPPQLAASFISVRRQGAEKEAAARRATEKQILEDAEHLIAVWNERQAKRMPMLFSPTIGAAITAGYWFLRARCPACRTVGDVDLRTAVIALSPTSEQAAQSGRRMRGSAALNGMMHNLPRNG